MIPEASHAAPFAEIALLLCIAAGAGLVAVRLHQPVLIAYIIVGIVAGPAVLGLVEAHDQINLLAQTGVAVLLFLVGLRLDLHHLRHIGPVALATGLGQLAFTILFGFLIIFGMGREVMEALYVAVALTFSSTIIIVKLLSDKRELDSLHGRIAVGFLIVQDIAVVLAMMVMSTLRGAGESAIAELGLSILGRVSVAALLMYVLMRHVLPAVVRAMARSQELLLVFAIAWGTGLAALGEWAGFSKEAGAFLAGFSLASTAYRDAIGARLSSIRDFLLLFFFVDLGAKLDFSTLGGELWPAAILSAFVLIGNPLIVMAIMGYMGYRRRTGFLAGLTVAQISEFSIVFVAMGISLGHVGVQALGLTTLVGVVTITLSTYMIMYSQELYARLGPWLALFERRRPHRELAAEQQGGAEAAPDVIVFGMGRYGERFAAKLVEAGFSVLGIEHDPERTEELRPRGIRVSYGDAQDPDYLETLPLDGVSWIVSTLPDLESNGALLHGLRQRRYQGDIAIVARDEAQGAALKQIGAPTVLYPFRDAVDFAVEHLGTLIRSEKAA
ncbi:MAG: cation:proton antiporter [Burkholderiales bacterium]|jgi:Kef-type K+ transport system membrane component KefB|nr:cation:proton antiporter [Burkholderiales bacterium]